MKMPAKVSAICIALVAILSGQADATPTVTIKFAPEIRSEDVTIYYYLYGTFGGVGSMATPARNVRSYRINPVYEGKLASSVKAVIYASGCEFTTFEFDITGESIDTTYVCTPLPTLSLVGHISQTRLVRDRDLEVVVWYLGDWECRFFDLFDCMVPQIQLARAPVNENGEFEATIVDFSPEQSPPMRHRAELWLALRDAKTWNLIGAGLVPPKELRTRSITGLAIRPFYPPPIEFDLALSSSSRPKDLNEPKR